MTYANLRTLLKTLTPEVYRWAAPAGKTRYIVCRRYGYSLLRGDDSVVARLPRIHLDVYYQDEEDELLDNVLDLLDEQGQGYDLQDVVYDEALELFRGVLTLEVTGL